MGLYVYAPIREHRMSLQALGVNVCSWLSLYMQSTLVFFLRLAFQFGFALLVVGKSEVK